MGGWQDGSGGVPPPPPPMQPSPPAPTRSDLPGGLVLAGGILVVIGVFLPWITATEPLRSASVSGLKIGTYGTLLLGGFAIARGASLLRPGMFNFTMGTPIIGGVLILVLLAIRWSSLQDDLRALRSFPGVTASVGIGVWAVVLGAILVIVGGVLAGPTRRRF
jgi:hypothetical protein